MLLLTVVVTERILNRDPLEEIRKAFKLFDEDGTGRISLRNLRHIAMELGENIDDDELRAMIDEFDLDGDGESKWGDGWSGEGPRPERPTACRRGPRV